MLQGVLNLAAEPRKKVIDKPGPMNRRNTMSFPPLWQPSLEAPRSPAASLLTTPFSMRGGNHTSNQLKRLRVTGACIGENRGSCGFCTTCASSRARLSSLASRLSQDFSFPAYPSLSPHFAVCTSASCSGSQQPSSTFVVFLHVCACVRQWSTRRRF